MKGIIMSRTIRSNKGTNKGARKGAGKGEGASTRAPDDATFPRREGEGDDAYDARRASRDVLIAKLRDDHTRNEGKGIRRRLRALGHFGGLRHERAQGRALDVARNVIDNARPPVDAKGARNAC